MYVRVLGSAAGGGYPQWNCNHPNSRRAREDDAAAPQRTQSSIAVSSDGEHWVLFNASPDLRQQINDNDILQPRVVLRGSPIQAVVLTNADVDHVAGLLNLRESQPLMLYGTERVLSVLENNSIFNVLNPKFVTRAGLVLEQELNVMRPDGESTSVGVVPFAVTGEGCAVARGREPGREFRHGRTRYDRAGGQRARGEPSSFTCRRVRA